MSDFFIPFGIHLPLAIWIKLTNRIDSTTWHQTLFLKVKMLKKSQWRLSIRLHTMSNLLTSRFIPEPQNHLNCFAKFMKDSKGFKYREFFCCFNWNLNSCYSCWSVRKAFKILSTTFSFLQMNDSSWVTQATEKLSSTSNRRSLKFA